MGAEPAEWRSAIASALEWWHEAGVDSLVAEAPRDWLARAPRPIIAPSASVPAAIRNDAPGDLAAFTAWRIGPEAPEAGWPGTPLFADGTLSSGLMVLVDCPERDDEAAGLLLSGPAGRLFDRMLAAIGERRETVLLAPLMTRRPYGRLAPAVEEQLAGLARRHVALASPRRLLLLGNAASRAIAGADMMAARGALHRVNPSGASVGAVASFSPRLLLDRPACKADAWKDLQMLMGAPDA